MPRFGADKINRYTGSATKASAVTLHDTNEVTVNGQYPRAFMVATAGTLNVTTAEGDAVQLNVSAGVMYPISCKLFRSGGTATGVMAFN